MRSSPKHLVALALTAFVLCYAGVVLALVSQWSTHYIYSYAFAVPLISGYVAWNRWKDVQATPIVPDYAGGLVITLAGISALVAGQVGALLAVAQLSLLVTITGLVLLFLGRRWLRSLAFPILYLLLCIPIWDYPIGLFQEPSQTISARIALPILHSMGVPALREDTHLVLPSVTLEVLRECSGVNQLVAIVAMTLPAAFLWLKSNSRRIALVTIAVATAYLSNGLRIALIGLLAYNNVKGAHSQGPLHILQGLVVSSLGYLLIGSCLSALARTEQLNDLTSDAKTQHISAPFDRIGFPWPQTVVVVILLMTAAYTQIFQPVDVRLRQDLHAFPTVIGDWTADSTTPSLLKIQDVDDELSRIYRNPQGTSLELYVGYHRFQIEGKEFGSDANRVAHALVSRSLSPSGGAWLQDASQSRPEELETVSWFDVNGRVLPNVYLARAVSIWDAITTRRTNAAVVIVRWAKDVGAENAAYEDEIQFVRDLEPLLREYFPATANEEQRGRRHTIAPVSP